MKANKLLLATLVITGTLGLSALPAWADDILYKVQMPGTDYCHMKFPAIREDTLSWNRPALKDKSTSDIVDFAGPCDHSPLGKDEIYSQKIQRQRDNQSDVD